MYLREKQTFPAGNQQYQRYAQDCTEATYLPQVQFIDNRLGWRIDGAEESISLPVATIKLDLRHRKGQRVYLNPFLVQPEPIVILKSMPAIVQLSQRLIIITISNVHPALSSEFDERQIPAAGSCYFIFCQIAAKPPLSFFLRNEIDFASFMLHNTGQFGSFLKILQSFCL